MLSDMSDTDMELPAHYTRQHAEDAFAHLVRRHLGLVYSAALRQVRSPQLAEEVAQSVFINLARKAARLKPDSILSAWLYQVTRRTAIDVVRREASRQLREQIATEMNAMTATAAAWTHIEPLLDEAMHALDDTDRAAVLLRYFERKSAHEIAQTLGVSEEAAQKRVSRAVERLREFFAKRGVTIGASGLVVVISANAVQAAPVGLAVTVSTAAALAGTTLAATATATATKAIVMTTLQKTLIVATLIAASVATPLVIQHQAHVKLLEENQSWRQRVDELAQRVAENARRSPSRVPAPRLPAPRMPVTAPPAENTAEDSTSTNLIDLIDRILGGNQAPKLTAGQVESYLKENQRSAASLLAAYRTTGERTLLDEAMQKFPNDPQVAFEAAFKKDATPEEQRQWLNALKQSAPHNALADYLSAAHFFKTGQPDQAVQELIAASGKPQFQDYTLERVQDDEEAYRAAGYSVAEAKTIPSMQLLLPQLAQMKELSQDLAELAKSYRKAGDETSAQAALQMAAGLGQRYSNVRPGEPEISQLVGIVIERIALNAMDPNSPYGSAGGTVKDRLDQLAQQRAELEQLARQTEALQPLMSDQDLISYKDRWRNFGEGAAGRWLINKYGQK